MLPGDLSARFRHFFSCREAYAPLLWFSPVQTQWCKLVATAGFLAMHIGFGAAMKLGTFSYVACVALLPLLPSMFWDRFVFRWTRTNPRVAYVSVLCPSFMMVFVKACMRVISDRTCHWL